MLRSLQAFESWVCAVFFMGMLSLVPSASAAQGLPFKLPQSFASFNPLRLDNQQKRWLEAHGALRVGITLDDYEPVDITSDRNRYQGISADYLSIIRDTLGAKVEVVGYRKRAEAVADLLSGKIDMLASANGFERGIEGLAFSEDYLIDRPVIVVRASEAQPIENWVGKKIGFVDGYVDIQTAHAFYPDSQLIITPTLHSAMEALTEGDIDAFIGNEIIVQSFKSVRPYSKLRILGSSALPVSGFSFATRQADRQMVALINQVLGSVDETLCRAILARWTHGLEGSIAQQHIDLLHSEREWIKANPVVMLASQQFPLYAFKNIDGDWEGLNIDILARITRMTGLQFAHIETFSTMQTLDLLKGGIAHMNSTLSITPERKAFLNFSYSYGGAPWVFVVRSHDVRLGSLDQLAGKVLALPAKHALEDMVRREYPTITVKSVDTFEQARDLVESGEADATIQSETQAHLYPQGRLKVGRSVDGRWSADTFAVNTQHPELLSILNKALEAMTEIRSLRSKWLGGGGAAPSVGNALHHSYWLYALMAVLSAFSLCLFLCNRKLHKQIFSGQVRENVLREDILLHQRFLDGIPSPIFVVGLKGEVISCNHSYEDRLSIKLERILGLNSIEINLYPQAQAEQFHSELMGMLQSRKSLYKKRYVEFKSGGRYIYQWTVPFYATSGELVGLMGGWFDISEMKKWDPL